MSSLLVSRLQFGFLYRHSRCISSSSPISKLDPLLADVLSTQEQQPSKSMRSNPLDIAKIELPHMNEWNKHFLSLLSVRHRVSIRNPITASSIADAFIPAGSEGKVVIEAFPGPGQLTRALLKLPKKRIKKLIVMEDHEPYLDYLRPLEQLDPRVKVIPRDGHAWDSYKNLEELDILSDVRTVPWQDGVHPKLHFISHLPSSVHGEQLIAQLFRSVPDQQWLFQYGRVPLSFILSTYVWKRISSTIDNKTERCKLSVVAEAVASCSEALPVSRTSPYEEHFHPAPSAGTTRERLSSRSVGNPFQTIQVIPLENQVIKPGKLDKWDYCLRRLFVKKATPLASAIPGLGPGAQSLIKKIADPNLPDSERIQNVKTQVRQMTVHDWSVLIKAFDEWPFAPQDLSIGDPLK